MGSARLTTAAAIALVSAHAVACGYCVEDRVAAVYDYGITRQAADAGRSIAYLGIEGRHAQLPAAATQVGDALRASPLVDPATIRTATTPGAAAFAWSGDAQALAAILDSLAVRLADAGLRVELLRVWDARRGLH